MGISSGIDEIGGLRWENALCHLAGWVFVFLCTMKGAASVGKVVYVTATLPYLLIGVLLVYGLTLDGAIDGIKFFLYPDFEKLTNISVWIEAAGQVLYQCGPAWGGVITIASCNKFDNKVYKYVDIFLLFLIYFHYLFFQRFLVAPFSYRFHLCLRWFGHFRYPRISGPFQRHFHVGNGIGMI